MKAGFVSLVGRPNAGKSTLLNRFAGQKLAIVSDKPQTTRHRIVGVRHSAAGQIVFIDTPGIHKPMHRMNRRMVETATETLREVDVVVLVLDVTTRPGLGDRFVLDLVKRAGMTAVLALNKIDRIRKNDLLPIIERYARAHTFAAIVPVSAEQGDGVEQLEAEILAALPEGDPLFPDDYLTDQTERTLAAELIREKVLHHTRDELPYTTGVVIEQFEEPDREGGLTKIHASILVEGESQKPIVVGKGGAMIKRIGTEARHDLEEMLGGKVFLDLHVKVREDWRDNERILDEMGLRRGR
ncbi:MAG: GTPase Era [Acidobacteria bacterium SCN 69-37]|nr:MAG: GTPase Era [Acidobacteria bacterium SCN 69-37]